MPQPFSVRDQSNPGVDLGDWDTHGNITIPGTLTAANVIGGGGGGGGGVATVTAGSTKIAIGGTATAVTVDVNQANLTVAESQVTNLTTDLSTINTSLSGKAPLASPTFTGVVDVNGVFVIIPDSLSFTSTVTPDASTGNFFRLTLTGAVTIASPTNGADGQKIVLVLKQDGTGSRVPTLGSGINLGPLTYTPSTAANKKDYLGMVWDSTTSTWDVLAVGAGY